MGVPTDLTRDSIGSTPIASTEYSKNKGKHYEDSKNHSRCSEYIIITPKCDYKKINDCSRTRE